MRNNLLITLLVLLTCAACSQEKYALIYKDVLIETDDAVFKLRLSGTSDTESSIAVGPPYDIFFSLSPSDERYSTVSIQLIGSSDGEVIILPVMPLKFIDPVEGSPFMAVIYNDVNMSYQNYVAIVSLNGKAINEIKFNLVTNQSKYDEPNWWSRMKSI